MNWNGIDNYRIPGSPELSEEAMPATENETATTSMVCMSVVRESLSISFAAYNEEAKTIIIEEFAANDDDMQLVIERALNHIRPTLLLLSSKIVANESLLEILTSMPDILKEDMGGNFQSESSAQNESLQHEGEKVQRKFSPSLPYRCLKASALDLGACKRIILKLRVASLTRRATENPSLIAHRNERHRSFSQRAPSMETQCFKVTCYHALASVVNFDSIGQVKALGSLLFFLQSTLFRMDTNGYIDVADVLYCKCSKYMHIPSETLSSLHIFTTEYHPIAAAKGYGNSKEGFSLFSLLDRTKSKPGRQRLREWMLKPLIDVQEIELRQLGVELFIMMPEMSNLLGLIYSYLERIGLVDQILLRIQKCNAKPVDFLSLAKSLSSALAIICTLNDDVLHKLRQYLSDCEADLQQRYINYMKFISSILDRSHVTALTNLFERITSIIDEEATYESKALIIRKGHHTQLDFYKEEFARLEGSRLARRAPQLRNFMEIMFIPQIGFLVALESTSGLSEGDIPNDFIFVFTEGEKSVFKCEDVHNLDENVGDLDAYIKDTELFIVSELEEEILDVEREIRESFSALSDLDCILAFAECAVDLKYVKPTVLPAEEKQIKILNGRHPLQEAVMESDFISNDTVMDISTRVSMITGPNFSGKSCYARQVGLLVYMAHLGSFIPCDEAHISIHDQIIARFSTHESCSIPQSSFQLSLVEISQTLRQQTQNSLVIIDEFGKGTNPASGIALLTAIIRKLAMTQCMVICTTHFIETFSMGLLEDGKQGIRAMRMAVRVSNSSENEVYPLFVLEEGVATSSAGLACAKIAGVPEAVIDRANEFVRGLKERRKVHPLLEILRSNLNLSQETKELLNTFLFVTWKKASNKEVDQVLSNISEI